ncbi:glutathione S-transferase family protein [Limnobacter humi]|uniref:Glutathione S-transferase family protein n=1 Tax=Limnobacter humi TaxID=1778671 RepID=A0ABT1WGL2_9BURK|nr:glutathione S-transferase family protein [Limnobacter humi]MCQ8896166.1 glutathione S-transferase family protein [Limnobacter humi]
MNPPEPLKVHGLDLSYFTGKLEAYLRGKGIAYDLIEMDTRDFKACGQATGVAQMPQVEWENGQWLSDTTLILEFLDRVRPETSITPTDPVAWFTSRVLEDFSDEWLWRPALAHRWANPQDARLMGQRLAEGMMRDVPLPTSLRRWVITKRQQLHFLWMDGYRPSTGQRIKAHYTECLAALEAVLQHQPYVMGARPTLADYGFFGSMFRHFFSDPTPAGIMRREAPNVMEWVARLWNTRLVRLNAEPLPSGVLPVLNPLMHIVVSEFIPYAQANESAVIANRPKFTFHSGGVDITVPIQRYRAWRFQRLRTQYQALPANAQAALQAWQPALCAALTAPIAHAIEAQIKQLPIAPRAHRTMVARTW